VNRNDRIAGTQVAAFQAANRIANDSTVGAMYYSDKQDFDDKTGGTPFYPAGTRITIAGRTFFPDGDWPGVGGIEATAKYLFLVPFGGAARLQIDARHEVGHASDHHAFGDGAMIDPAHDHSDTNLMNPGGLTNIFSDNDILKLRGWTWAGP
jgi:hypothetical protein